MKNLWVDNKECIIIKYIKLLIETVLLASLFCLPLFFDGYTWLFSLFAVSFYFWRLEALVEYKTDFYCYGVGFGATWAAICSIHLFLALYVTAGLSLWLSFIGWLVIVSYCLLFFMFLIFLYFNQKKQHIALRLISFISLWCLCEYLRLWLFSGYSLFSFSYMHTQSPLNVFAPVGGDIMVSLVVLLLSLSLSFCLRKKILIKYGVTIILFIFGFSVLSNIYPWSSKQRYNPLKVALIQTGKTIEQRYDDNKIDRNVEIIKKTQVWLDKIDTDTELVLTPEGYLESFFNLYEVDFFKLLHNWAKTHSAGFFFGIFELTYGFGEHGFYYFATLFVDNKTLQTPIKDKDNWWDNPNTYRKRDLIPFTEYIPAWAKFLGLREWLPMGSGEIGKREKRLWQVKPDFWVAPSICYEFYFGNNIRNNARGANLLINQGYQSWFESSWGPQLFQRISRMRALESAKPVLRVDGYGITSLIDPKGRDVFALPVAITQVKQTKVYGYKGETLYYRFGYLPVVILLLLGWGWVWWLYRRKSALGVAIKAEGE